MSSIPQVSDLPSTIEELLQRMNDIEARARNGEPVTPQDVLTFVVAVRLATDESNKRQAKILALEKELLEASTMIAKLSKLLDKKTERIINDTIIYKNRRQTH